MSNKKYILLFTFIFCLLTFVFAANATIRYVSHTGSSTPPYLTWETAADSIMTAINVSAFGDTIYVANGVYEEEVVMIAGLSLIGAGSDSCIIDTRDFTEPQAVNVNSDCLLKNFKIITQNSSETNGQGIVIGSLNSIIEFNEILHARIPGIWCYNNNSIIRHNKIMYCYRGILIDFNQPTIDSNYIYINTELGAGIGADLYSNPFIRGNLIVMNHVHGVVGYSSGFNNGANILNNLFYSLQSDETIYAFQAENIENNVITGNYDFGITRGPMGEIKNNIVSGGSVGIRIINGSPSPLIRYNNVWNNQKDFQNYSPDSTNLSVDPMFVNEDSLDLHLQEYSPLIDAGDPEILDKDSSRSDIGLYGGPYGENYTYIDLPPRPPVNLSAEIDTVSNIVILNWNKNSEADTSYYNVYRDSTINFPIDSSKLISSQADTVFLDVIPPGYSRLIYKITAVDQQGNESQPSEEQIINIVGVERDPVIVNNYILYQNYPNPFNPSTRIGYKLKERGYVKLYVYDIKAELVSVLVNQSQEAGYYEVEFNAEARGERQEVINQLASGIYIYQIMVRSEGGIPVFTDIKKMIYLK